MHIAGSLNNIGLGQPNDDGTARTVRRATTRRGGDAPRPERPFATTPRVVRTGDWQHSPRERTVFANGMGLA